MRLATWVDWNSSSITLENTTADLSWNVWTTIIPATPITPSQNGTYQYPVIEETDEQKAKARQQAAEYRERETQRVREQEQVKIRATELLRDHLTRHQKRQLDQNGHFTVLGSEGRRYRIERNTHGNVYCLRRKGNRWEPTENLCIQPGGVPAEDSHLAQKLMIETDEKAFRQIANIRTLIH